MPKRWNITPAVVVSFAMAATLHAQIEPHRQILPEAHPMVGATTDPAGAIVREIAFTGLRRISPEALKSQLLSRAGDVLDTAKIEHDVRTLARTGWFETVRADVADVSDAQVTPGKAYVRLIFFLPESPFLTKIEYSKSKLLSRRQIEKLLVEKNLLPKLGQPADPVRLGKMRVAIEAALAELGHPQGRARIVLERSRHATDVARFEISDGPHLLVGRVTFAGNSALSEKLLKRQMRRVSPAGLFAGVRGKDAYTPGGFEEDRERLLAYYQNHAYPDARVGTAKVEEYECVSRRWLPWPHRAKNTRLALTVPVEAGAFYHIDSMTASAALEAGARINRTARTGSGNMSAAQPYSALRVENLRRGWETRLRAQAKRGDISSIRDVEAIQTIDTTAHTVRIKFDLGFAPYTVRRLEFRGIHHFPDRYFRRRIGVKEGAPLDQHALEAGLRRLARTGYFKPIKRPDVQILANDGAHAIDVTIHIEELGQQRISMIGGRGQFGSTLGVAYTLFNIVDHEELLTSKIEGGPESLELALGLAKEGFLGTRGSLALSVFNTFLRPRLTGSAEGPFFKQRTQGVSADWSYSLSSADTLSTNYALSRSLTTYTTPLSSGLTGMTAGDVRAESSSRAAGVGWTRDTGSERIVVADSVSGGWLGGSENVVRSKLEYARVVRDPILHRGNAWAFRSVLMGAGSYSGEMPPPSRLFAGDGLVRGLKDGELGPAAIVSSTSSIGAASPGATHYSASPAGANLIGAMNAEYRVQLSSEAEAAGFLDLGSGLLLPNWLGTSRPSLVESTNGVVHGSTGVELRWTLPGIGVPVRAYYALNVLRLNRPVLMPDASLFRTHNRWSAFGWGLGSLF